MRNEMKLDKYHILCARDSNVNRLITIPDLLSDDTVSSPFVHCLKMHRLHFSKYRRTLLLIMLHFACLGSSHCMSSTLLVFIH